MASARITAPRGKRDHDDHVQFSDNAFPSLSSGEWGSYERRFSAHGLTVEHLRVLPPDASAQDRLRWSLTAIWPVVGFFLGIAVSIVAHRIASVEVGAAAGFVAWTGPWLWLAWNSRAFAREIHEEWRIGSAGSWGMDESPLRERASRLMAASSGTRTRDRDAVLRRTWISVHAEMGVADSEGAARRRGRLGTRSSTADDAGREPPGDPRTPDAATHSG